MRTDLVLDALRMALVAPPRRRRRRARAPLRCRQSNTPAYAFTQVLDDHGVLASIGSVGDAYDNALAESFVDSFKTELIADRVWRTRTQLELAVVEYVGWFNHDRLHEALGDLPPAEFEQRTPRKPRFRATDRSRRSRRGPQIASTRLGLSANAPATAQTALSAATDPRAGFAGNTPLIEGNQLTRSPRTQPGAGSVAARDARGTRDLPMSHPSTVTLDPIDSGTPRRTMVLRPSGSAHTDENVKVWVQEFLSGAGDPDEKSRRLGTVEPAAHRLPP